MAGVLRGRRILRLPFQGERFPFPHVHYTYLSLWSTHSHERNPYYGYSHALNSVPDFSSGVIVKLMSFTFAMITLPIGTYFFTNAYVFNGKHVTTI